MTFASQREHNCYSQNLLDREGNFEPRKFITHFVKCLNKERAHYVLSRFLRPRFQNQAYTDSAQEAGYPPQSIGSPMLENQQYHPSMYYPAGYADQGMTHPVKQSLSYHYVSGPPPGRSNDGNEHESMSHLHPYNRRNELPETRSQNAPYMRSPTGLVNVYPMKAQTFNESQMYTHAPRPHTSDSDSKPNLPRALTAQESTQFYPQNFHPRDMSSSNDFPPFRSQYSRGETAFQAGSDNSDQDNELHLEAISSNDEDEEDEFDDETAASNHRLKLVLDLDNTLVHACSQLKLNKADIPLEAFLSPDGEPELFSFVLPQAPTISYYVKFRPGIYTFLRKVSKYCDLAIHTNATREYAEVIVALLDPTNQLFRRRIAARDDETSRDLKKHMNRLFGSEDLNKKNLLILDDRKDVWEDEYQAHIIHCGMYDYLDSRRQALVKKYVPQSTSEAPEGRAELQPQSVPLDKTIISPDPRLSATEVSQTNSGEEEEAMLKMVESPFQENPLVLLSSESNLTDDDDECEDDDIVSPEQASASDDNRDSPKKDALSEATEQTAEQKYANLTENLLEEDEMLIDYDRQLDYIGDLVQELALKYSKRYRETNTAPNVADLLMERRLSILLGTVFQTAGMYKSELSHPEFGWHDNGPVHRRRLVQLGASVVEQRALYPPPITHLLAMRATQTIDRIKREQGAAVQYVHALWLHACESTWSRVPEQWFEAMTLLKKYNNSPPKKPWVDHWKILALHSCDTSLRLSSALQKQFDTKQDVVRVNKVRLVPEKKVDGTKIWTPTECITLRYEPPEVEELNPKFGECERRRTSYRPESHFHSRVASPPISSSSFQQVSAGASERRRPRRNFHDKPKRFENKDISSSPRHDGPRPHQVKHRKLFPKQHIPYAKQPEVSPMVQEPYAAVMYY